MSVATWTLAAAALVISLGTLLPQQPAEQARQAAWQTAAELRYGPLARAFAAAGLFAFYRSPWLILPAGALLLSLLACTLLRLRPVWRSATAQERPPSRSELAVQPFQAEMPLGSAEAGLQAAREALRDAGFRLRPGGNDPTTVAGERHRAAHLGTLLTHLAPFLLLGGLALSHLAGWRGGATIGPGGQTAPIGPAGRFQVRLDRWQMESHPDGSPAEYQAGLTVLQDGRPVQEGVVRVNHPLHVGGFSLLLVGATGEGEVELLAVREPGFPLVVASWLLLVVGVCLTLYLPHQQSWVWIEGDGTLRVAGKRAGRRPGRWRRFERLVACLQRHLTPS